MTQLYGTLPSQVPTNADLGTMAFQDANAIKVGIINATGLTTSADSTIHGITIGLGGSPVTNYNLVMGQNPPTAITGSQNILVGQYAGYGLTTGTNNVAIGNQASPALTTGGTNVFIGSYAGNLNATGSNNVAIGFQAGYATVGSITTYANISGSKNTWLGMYAGPGTTTQLSNSTAIGYGALNLNSNEMVLGNSSLTSVTTAAAITATGGFIGHASLDLPLTGGVVTGGLTTNGYTALGYGVTQVAPSATAIYTTASVNLGGTGGNGLWVGQYPTSNTAWMQSSFTNPTTATYHLSMQPLGGNVGIGTGSTAPVSALQVNGAVSAGGSTIGASIGQFQASCGTGNTWYNAGFRNDGNNVYLLSSTVQTTQAAAANATYNTLRPVSWNLSSGAVTIDGSGSGTTFGGTLTTTGATINTSGNGLLVTGSSSGNIAAIITNTNAAGFAQLQISSTGTNASKFIRVSSGNGNLELVNSAYTAVVLSVSDAGAVIANTVSLTSSGLTNTLKITDTGVNGANIELVGNGSTTPNKFIRASGGNFQILNSAYSNVILNLDDAGDLTVGSVITGNVTTTGNIYNSVVNAGIEHGNTTTANSPYIDFHSSGNANDYDARLIANGGTTNGTGNLGFAGAQFVVNGLTTPLIVNSTNSINIKLAFQEAGVNQGFIGSAPTMSFYAINKTNTSYTFSVDQSGNGTFQGSVTAGTNISASGALTVGGTLNSGGLAALGSAVTQAAPSATNLPSTASTYMGGAGGNGLFVGQYPVSNMAWIQSSFNNPTTATYHISLQPLGGNVGIGTGSTAPVSLLQVNGLITAGSLTSTGTITSSGYLYTGYNSGGSAYPASSFGGAIGGNWSNGDAEVNYWNANTGAANLSFTWRQLTGASASTQLMQLSPSGILTVTTCIQTSDETKKENWVVPDSRSAVEFLATRSKYGNFDWKEVTGSSLGCSAQEFKSSPVFENAIHESDEGLAMNYGGAAIVACISLAKELELLRAELAELKRSKCL